VEKKKRGEMQARERVKEVEEGSWTCCGTKKGHGRDGAAAGGQVVGLERRGVAGSVGDCRRGAAGGAVEQQRGRGERKMMGTCSQFFKSSRGLL
jgi:hypothetical protein